MKKLLFIVLAIICTISLLINIFLVINLNNAKKTYQYDIYSHLVNISKLLDNIKSSNNDSIVYNLSSLERECIQLDDSIQGLCVLSSNNTSPYKFEDFENNISKIVTENTNDPEKLTTAITQYKEIIQRLIRDLSPKGKISNDEYGNISLTPNYSITIKQIITLINDTLVNMQKAT